MKRSPLSLLRAVTVLLACNGSSPETGPTSTEPSRTAPGQASPTISHHAAPLEVVPDAEAKAILDTVASRSRLIERTHPPGVRPVQRAAHAKAHGCVKALVTVPHLAPTLRVGVFAKPRTYNAWIRYSSAFRTSRDDAVEDGRGMAIKLMGVAGKKLLESAAEATTHDFLMASHPVFFLDTAQEFAAFDMAEGDRKIPYFIWHPRGAEIAAAILEKVVVNPLQTRYWGMTPYLFGDRVVKYSAKPCEIQQDAYRATGSSDFLADNMELNLANGEGCFELMVQFQTEPESMPVEQPMIEWSETDSPFLKVAEIRIPAQTFRSKEQASFCENLSFNPWQALPVHRPLGGLNRLRKVAYDAVSALRHKMNDAPRVEPTAGPDFFD